MEWIKENYEKAVLAIVALICVVFGVLHILSALSYADQFKLSSKPPQWTEPDVNPADIKADQKILELPFNWDINMMDLGEGQSKQVPVFRSVPIVEKDNKLFDMLDPREEQLRPPIPNEWLIQYNLPYLTNSVLNDDTDNDGFSNLEEFQTSPKTSPVDRDDHPPFTDKLYLVERKQKNFFITFAAKNGDLFQLNFKDSQNRGGTEFLEMGASFGPNGRYTLVGYEEKEGTNSIGATVDISELKVSDAATGEEFLLQRRQQVNHPDYYAVFFFALDPGQFASPSTWPKEGASFSLSSDPATQYTLKKVETDGATIVNPEGQDIQIGPKPASVGEPEEPTF